jgi:periplasmic protein TonB
VTYRILLIDGDAARAAKRSKPLADAGHEVDVAGSPDAALLSFERSTPHLVVIDATHGEATIRDLCGLLKKQAPHVPLVLLTDVVRDPQHIALVLNQYSCDQLIDRSLDPDRMLRLIGQLVDTHKAGPADRPTHGGTDSAGATLWLDSEELVNALEKLDTIITHKAASQVQLPPREASSGEIQISVDAQVDRDVPARRFADEADGGRDIDDHLDTVFARGRSAASPQPPPQAPGVTPPPAPRGAAPVRESVVVKATQAGRGPGTTSALRDPNATVALPVARPAPPAPESRGTPDALRPVEAPRVAAPRTDVAVSLPPHAPASTMRWFIAATVVVTLLGAGYLVLFRGSPHMSPATVASNTTTPAEAPPFTPAADGAADATDDVRSAGSTVPVAPPTAAPAASAPPVSRPSTPTQAPTPKPTPKPAAKSPAPQKPVATPAPKAQKTQKPSPPPAPVATSAPKVTAPERPVIAATPVIAPSDPAPVPTPVPKAAEPVAAPLVAEAEPKPVKAEPGPIVPAAVIKRVEPTYSPKAVKGIGDPRVVLRVLVDPQGRITRVLVDKGIPGSELEAAAVSAILRWQFRPGTQDGKPVESWATAEFRFGD